HATRAAYLDLPTHNANKVVADGQSQPRALSSPVAAFGLEKWLKKFIQFIGGDPIAGIGDYECCLAILPARLHAHAALRRELDGIGHQIDQHLAQFVLVAKDIIW